MVNVVRREFQGQKHEGPEALRIFSESALRPIQSISCDVRLFVCLFVCGFVRHTLETTLPEGLETSGRRAYR